MRLLSFIVLSFVFSCSDKSDEKPKMAGSYQFENQTYSLDQGFICRHEVEKRFGIFLFSSGITVKSKMDCTVSPVGTGNAVIFFLDSKSDPLASAVYHWPDISTPFPNKIVGLSIARNISYSDNINGNYFSAVQGQGTITIVNEHPIYTIKFSLAVLGFGPLEGYYKGKLTD